MDLLDVYKLVYTVTVLSAKSDLLTWSLIRLAVSASEDYKLKILNIDVQACEFEGGVDLALLCVLNGSSDSSLKFVKDFKELFGEGQTSSTGGRIGSV